MSCDRDTVMLFHRVSGRPGVNVLIDKRVPVSNKTAAD